MTDNNDVEQTNQPDQQNEPPVAQNHEINEKRNMICFWIVGLCNTYGPIKNLNGVSVRNEHKIHKNMNQF